MQDALKPTDDMISKVMGDPSLLEGFDDPEVMKAVEEISKDPSAMMKYQNNPKVIKFYQKMAGFVGDRLTDLGEKEQMKGRK